VTATRVTAGAPMGHWGTRAARLYNEAYARRYFEYDDQAFRNPVGASFAAWLGDLCQTFDRPITVLDLGCGTGRFFPALTHVREIVGVDASAAMLARARERAASACPRASVTLIEGDVETIRLDSGRFDLAYAIGVLAEHVPLTTRLAARVGDWLAPHGVFAFTTVHPESPSIGLTWRRRLGRAVVPWTAGPVREWLRRRWLGRGLYADEEYVGQVMGRAGFRLESLSRFESEEHLHCLVVARSRQDRSKAGDAGNLELKSLRKLPRRTRRTRRFSPEGIASFCPSRPPFIRG
jgi:SAM-dependent methyltransferase